MLQLSGILLWPLLMSVAQNSVFDLRTYVHTYRLHTYVACTSKWPSVYILHVLYVCTAIRGVRMERGQLLQIVRTLRKKKEQTENIGIQYSTYVPGTVKQG